MASDSRPLIGLKAGRPVGEGSRWFGGAAMIVSSVTTVMFMYLFLAGFFRLFAAFFDDFDVIVKNGGYYWHHVGLDNTSAYIFSSSDTDINHTLESKIPFPHAHHIFTPALL